MSSILDSLKKLEKETAQQDQLPTHAGNAIKAVVPKRIAVIIGVTCLCITAIGLAVYYKGLPDTHPESPTRNRAMATNPAAVMDEPEKSLASAQDTQTPLPAKPINRATTVSVKTPEPSDSIAPSKPMPPEDNIPGRDVRPGSEAQAPAIKEPRQEIKMADTAHQERVPQNAAMEEGTSNRLDDVSPKAAAEKTEPRQIDRLEGVGFKIQAISWSEIPEQSLAVINSQVVRVGDGIEGYQISRINPDDIVLLREGKAFRLEFRSTGP